MRSCDPATGIRSCRLTWLLALAALASASDAETAASIKTRLLQSYGDVSTRPNVAEAKRLAATSNGTSCVAINRPPPDKVYTQIYVDRFHFLNQRLETYGFEGYLRSWWRDPALQFNSSGQGSCLDKLSFTRQESARIWKPGFYWEKAVKISLPTTQEMIQTGAGQLLEVYPDGSVFWSQQVSMIISCPMDLYKMPFDTQKCTYLIGLYAATADEVVISWKSDEGIERPAFAGAESACLPEFVLSGAEQDSPIFQYEHPYSYARVVLAFSRWPGPLMWSYVGPAVALVAMFMLGFYIAPSSTPARVALGIIGILAVLTNSSQLSSIMPPGYGHTWLQQFLMVSFGFNAIAFCEQVAVSYGLQVKAWHDAERKLLELNRDWRLSIASHRHELSELFQEWDLDGDGKITKREFRQGIDLLQTGVTTEKINRLFDTWDVDRRGYLSLEELSRRMSTIAREDVDTCQEASDIRVATSTADAGGEAFEGKPQPAGGALVLPDVTPSPLHASMQPDLLVQEATRHGWEATTPCAACVQSTEASLAAVEARPQFAGAPLVLPPAVQQEEPLESPSSNSPQHFRRRRSSNTLDDAKVVLDKMKLAKSREFRRNMLNQAKEMAKQDLDRGYLWSFKYYHLSPALAKLRHLDRISRSVFPVAYIAVVLVFLSGVDFGHETPLAGKMGSGKYPCLDKKTVFEDGSTKLGFAGF